MAERGVTATNSNFIEGAPLTVEKFNEMRALLAKNRLPHSVYNVGSVWLFNEWLNANNVIETEFQIPVQVRSPSFSGIAVVETPALKFNQMAYVENGVIRGVFDLTFW